MPRTPFIAAAAVVLLAACASTPAESPAESSAGSDLQPRHLFDGETLEGWHADVPAADDDPGVGPAFVVRDGRLVSLGEPQGHLLTDEVYGDYRLLVEWRWPGTPGNCGVLVHASTPRELYGMFPRSIECQLHHENAGDFWCIGENLSADDMETRRGGDPSEWGGAEGQRRRIQNLSDGAENPPGEWNEMVVECRGDTIDVWVNGEHVNHGFDCTASSGRIALQAEGAECEFRRVELARLE